MTQVIDKLMVKVGFDAEEVDQVRFRTALYAGNMIMIGTTIVFLALILK